MNLQEYEQIQPHMKVEDMVFLTPNSTCAWRVETLYTKEPDTIEWLGKMQPGEVLYDVGANIGLYTVYAGKRGVKVHAFEPEAQNFALLVKNVAANGFGQDDVVAWPLALADKPSIALMHNQTLNVGGSCSSYGESKDFRGNEKAFPHHHGSVATTIDIFADRKQVDHIKVDVDGFEHLVLKGAICTLGRVKSVLIEINSQYPEHTELVRYMGERGFEFDPAQVEAAQRKEGTFKGVGNMIFYRKE